MRGLVVFAALLVSSPAHATCMELPDFACEIIPTYGDCQSPATNVWSPGAPFTYRIGCEGDGLQSPDLLLDGKVLKAKPEPLRQCEQWSLWVLEEQLPEGATLTLSPAGAAKPVPSTLAIAPDAAKLPRVAREPRHDFVCSAPPDIRGPEPPVAPPPAGCASCVISPGSPSPVGASLLAIGALSLRRARRSVVRPRRG